MCVGDNMACDLVINVTAVIWVSGLHQKHLKRFELENRL